MILSMQSLALPIAWLCGVGYLAAAPATDKPDVKLEIRRAETKPAEGLTEATVSGTTNKVYLHPEPVVTNKDIARALAVVDEGKKPGVEVTLTAEGGKKLAQLTEGHRDKPLAILVDGKVVSAPVVREKITGGKAVLSVGTREEAERIARALRAH